jgi:hypothetical protein
MASMVTTRTSRTTGVLLKQSFILMIPKEFLVHYPSRPLLTPGVKNLSNFSDMACRERNKSNREWYWDVSWQGFGVGDIMQDRIIKTFLILSLLPIITFRLIMTSLCPRF